MKAIEIAYRYGFGEKYAREMPADAAAAKQRLDEGNRSFAAPMEPLTGEGSVERRVISLDARDLGLTMDSAPSQRPYAAILGCSDARVPVELIFGEGPNDLFVMRVAGNVLGNEILGSLRYALEHLGASLKLVVVLGHSGCGAVSAAVDVFLRPADYLTIASQHMLRSLLDRLLFVVHASARAMEVALGADVSKRPGYRKALIEMSAVANAALAAFTVQEHLGGAQSSVRAAYGVYVLETRQVWTPVDGGQAKLATPPADLAGFIALCDAAARSERLTRLLG